MVDNHDVKRHKGTIIQSDRSVVMVRIKARIFLFTHMPIHFGAKKSLKRASYVFCG